MPLTRVELFARRVASRAAAAAVSHHLPECTICLEVPARPETLPCNHTFCGNCVNQLLASGSKACPNCRAATSVCGDGGNHCARTSDKLCRFIFNTLGA